MPDEPKPPKPIYSVSELHSAFMDAFPQLLSHLQAVLSLRRIPISRADRATIDRKLQILLQRGHPYALAFMALSGTASKERLAYAVIEGAAREFLRTMNFRVGQQDACAYILQYLDKKLRPKTPAFRVRCYKETRDAMTQYLNELQGEEIARFQGVLDAWATTSDARKHITYLRTVETAARRFRREPPKRATQKLLLVLQDEYKSSAALFEMRLKLMLACRSDKDLGYWSKQTLNNLLSMAERYDSLRPVLANIDRHVRNALAHGWAVPDLDSNKFVFHDREHTIILGAGEFYRHTRCLTLTAHALCELEPLFLMTVLRNLLHGIWRLLAEQSASPAETSESLHRAGAVDVQTDQGDRMKKAVKRSMVVDIDALPDKFPTHRHSSSFWESLGRAVATFGFLEEVLGKAIFAFTATRPYDESEIQSAYEQWLPKLERALVDPLGGLISAYGKAVREHPGANIENLDELLLALRKASDIRNVLCHGSWQVPNPDGASLPLYANRRREVFDTAVDCQFLDQVQRHVAELACSVVGTVTAMGWAFPGSNGPGMPIWENHNKQDRSDS